MNEPVSLITAFVAGLLSFVSPCVLPIVPGYLSFISGVNVAQYRTSEAPSGLARRVGLTSLFYFVGLAYDNVSQVALFVLLMGFLDSGAHLVGAVASRRASA